MATAALSPRMARIARAARRRGLVVIAAVLIGALGALAMSILSPPKYSSSAILVVPSGAVKGGPGAASEADNLAATYAALIPQDQSVQQHVSQVIGVPPSTVAKNLSVVVEANSAILDLTFTADTPAAALAGMSTVADAVTGPHPLTSAIPGGSLDVVQLAEQPYPSSSGKTKSVALGGVLGLLLGLVLAVAWDRSDPRVDDLEDLRKQVGCPSWAGNLSPAAAASVVAAWRRGSDEEAISVALLPVGRCDLVAMAELRATLNAADPHESLSVHMINLAGAAMREGLDGTARLVVVVVAKGTPVAVAQQTVRQLHELHHPPDWAFLLGKPANKAGHPAPEAAAPPESTGADGIAVPGRPEAAEPARANSQGARLGPPQASGDEAVTVVPGNGADGRSRSASGVPREEGDRRQGEVARRTRR